MQGRRVLKDGDPVITYMFSGYAKQDIERIYAMELSIKADTEATVLTLEEISRVVEETNRLAKYIPDIYTDIRSVKQTVESVYDQLLGFRTEVAELRAEVDYLRQYVEQIYSYVKKPTSLETQRLLVGTTPIPLSDVDIAVKRIHIKVPSWAQYLVYIGNETKQNFILEPGDKETLEVENPRKVYVRSLGSVEIFIMFEV